MNRVGSLPVRERALVAVGVLLDGEDAVSYLSSDKERHHELSAAAVELTRLSPELRLSYVGSLLRRTVEEMNRS